MPLSFDQKRNYSGFGQLCGHVICICHTTLESWNKDIFGTEIHLNEKPVTNEKLAPVNRL